MSDAEQTHTCALVLSMIITEVCAISESWDKASNYFYGYDPNMDP